MSITPEYRTLGRFTPPATASTAAVRFMRSKDEELKSAYQRIAMLEADLLECREYIENDVDVNDGDDGPVPNRAMALVSMIDESLHGPGCF